MIINDERKQVTTPFRDIRYGECFIDEEGYLNMRVDPPDDGIFYNAVVLKDGQLWVADDDALVEKVNAKVTIW